MAYENVYNAQSWLLMPTADIIDVISASITFKKMEKNPKSHGLLYTTKMR